MQNAPVIESIINNINSIQKIFISFTVVGSSRQGRQGPPQSMPVSPLFWMLSKHEAHGRQGPPQSMPVSNWF